MVFGKEDAQSDAFWWAADKGGYKCNLVRNAETALEAYLDKHHDVVIIDQRHSKFFDAEALCRCSLTHDRQSSAFCNAKSTFPFWCGTNPQLFLDARHTCGVSVRGITIV